MIPLVDNSAGDGFPRENSPWLTDERCEELLQRTLTAATAVWSTTADPLLLLLPERRYLLGPPAAIASRAFSRLVAAGYRVEVAVASYPGDVLLSAEEAAECLPAIPATAFWSVADYADSITTGEIPGSVVADYMGGLFHESLPLTLPRRYREQRWAGVLNLEWVTPDEILGFTGAPRNLRLGLAGEITRAAAARIATFLGAENNLANIGSPLRQCLFRGDRQANDEPPRVNLHLVGGNDLRGRPALIGWYAGCDEQAYLSAAMLSRAHHITIVDEPLPRLVALVDGNRFRTLWETQQLLTRMSMAMATGGELILIAPGITGLSDTTMINDVLLRCGYSGAAVLSDVDSDRQSPAIDHWTRTQLLHGSQQGRCRIVYAVEEQHLSLVERVGLRGGALAEALFRYKPQHARNGWNLSPDGDRFYFVRDPTAGLWTTAERLQNRLHEFARRTLGKY